MESLPIVRGQTGSAAAPKGGRLTHWLGRLGVVLLLAGIGVFIGNRVWYDTRTWTPIDLPVALTVGHLSTPEFRVNLQDSFEIELAVDRPVPRALMDTVLGIGELPSSQPAGLRGFQLAWALRRAGHVVQRGLSDGHGEGYWGNTTGRVLGYFPAQKGQPYRLDIDVLEDGSRLAPYHPHLKVTVDVFDLDGYAIGEGLTELAAGAVAALGVGLVVAAILVRRRAATRQAALPVS